MLAVIAAFAVGMAGTETAHAVPRPVALVLCGWVTSQADCTSSVKPLADALNGTDYPNGIQFDLVPLALGPNGNATNDAVARAGEIDKRIQAFEAYGQTEIYLVGHSLGGLAARYYLRHGTYRDRVKRYVSMGTGQYGGWNPSKPTDPCTWAPILGNEIGLVQLCSRSQFLYELDGVLHGSTGSDTPNHVMYPWPGSGPTYLDDTPTGVMPWSNCTAVCRNDPSGHVEYYRITVTPADLDLDFRPPNLAAGVVFSAQELDGGNCDIVRSITDPSTGQGLTHPNEPKSAEVQGLVNSALHGTCTGVPTYIDWQP